jgi:hypothetical protein
MPLEMGIPDGEAGVNSRFSEATPLRGSPVPGRDNEEPARSGFASASQARALATLPLAS